MICNVNFERILCVYDMRRGDACQQFSLSLVILKSSNFLETDATQQEKRRVRINMSNKKRERESRNEKNNYFSFNKLSACKRKRDDIVAFA